MHLEINGSVSSAEPMTGASQAPVLCVLTGHTRVQGTSGNLFPPGNAFTEPNREP